MSECCTPRCMAIKLLIMGLILILARLYTAWDIWVVLGVILIIKAALMFIMPAFKNNKKQAIKKK